MEPRAALGAYDEASGRYELHASRPGCTVPAAEVAGALGVAEAKVRVVTRELGGNYGTRNNVYPEFALVAWAARRLRRPVKWTCERTEAFLTDEHARDLVSRAELALDAEGNFLALRCDHVSNVGAHAVSFIPLTKGMARIDQRLPRPRRRDPRPRGHDATPRPPRLTAPPAAPR